MLQDKPTPTSLNELHELKYLECVIKESLRLYPSVPFIMRRIKQDIQIGFVFVYIDLFLILNLIFV